MANTILVVYTTMSGSTGEVAEAIGKTLGESGVAVEVRRMEAVSSLADYDAVVIGAPMIIGWHREAPRFIARHAADLSQKPVAYFFTSLELTRTGQDHIDGVPVFYDPALGEAPRNPDRLNFKEKQTTPAAYLGPVLKKAPGVRPVSVGFFAGKLDYGTLGLLPKLFVRLIIRGKPGDYRDWDTITAWAETVRDRFGAAD